MGNGVLAFIVAISAGAWIYSKLMRNTGGNTQSALTVAGISGVLIFALVWVVASMLL